MEPATLYLGFDGVLHPRNVRLHEGETPRLLVAGHTLFENSPWLERVICARPKTRVILHTWWVFYSGYRCGAAATTYCASARSRGNAAGKPAFTRGKHAVGASTRVAPR